VSPGFKTKTKSQSHIVVSKSPTTSLLKQWYLKPTFWGHAVTPLKSVNICYRKRFTVDLNSSENFEGKSVTNNILRGLLAHNAAIEFGVRYTRLY